MKDKIHIPACDWEIKARKLEAKIEELTIQYNQSRCNTDHEYARYREIFTKLRDEIEAHEATKTNGEAAVELVITGHY